jgi:hypothetical protein
MCVCSHTKERNVQLTMSRLVAAAMYMQQQLRDLIYVGSSTCSNSDALLCSLRFVRPTIAQQF